MPGCSSFAVRLIKRVIAEGLWRLHQSQTLSLQVFANEAVRIDTLDRIVDGNSWHRGAILPGSSDGARNQCGGCKRTRRVMNQNDFRLLFCQCVQPGADG